MKLDLNDNQLKAVEKTEGPLRIVAGPGSGKTRTIVSKIVHILDKGLAKPEEILAITFTNKAANEIRERVQVENGSGVKNIYTYHGWCHLFLRIEAEAMGLPSDFTIMDQSDSTSMIKKLIDQSEAQIEKDDVIAAFEKISREEITVKQLAASEHSAHSQIAVLWDKYVNEKKVNGKLDFNDLISEVKNLVTTNEYIRTKWSGRYKYIFVDEFQDTNNIQFEIIRALTNENSNLTVVGDPDQNIYSWRGANIDLINNFNQWYPNAETIFLDTNYRSTPEIVKASNSLIIHNENRVNEFSSNPFKDMGRPVEIIQKEDERDESFDLARRIQKLKDEGYNYEDIAIIVRMSYKTRGIESALNYMHIPYRVIGAMKFFDRAEVKLVLKFLLFVAKQDNMSLLDIVNNPPKKFGPKKVQVTMAKADEEGMTMWNWMRTHKDEIGSVMSDWVEQTERMIEAIISGDDVKAVMLEYLDDIGYLNRLFDEPNRQENIKEALNIASESLRMNKKPNVIERIIDFYNDSLLASASDKETESGEVNIVTSHASKGTEFKVVFLYSFVEGHWPSTKAAEAGEIEEERRVAYVAMTRAMDRLYITLSNGWTPYGTEIEQSRFLDELLDVDKYNYSDEVKMSFTNEDTITTIEHKIDDSIFHNTFGEGVVVGIEGDFIVVEFLDGRIQEILIGHKSYRKLN